MRNSPSTLILLVPAATRLPEAARLTEARAIVPVGAMSTFPMRLVPAAIVSTLWCGVKTLLLSVARTTFAAAGGVED